MSEFPNKSNSLDYVKVALGSSGGKLQALYHSSKQFSSIIFYAVKISAMLFSLINLSHCIPNGQNFQNFNFKFQAEALLSSWSAIGFQPYPFLTMNLKDLLSPIR